MKGLVLVVCVGLLSLTATNSDTRTFKFQGTVTDKTDGGLIEEYFIDVYEGNDVIDSPKSDKKGRFEAHLFGGSEYTIDISLNGYYPKRVVVKTNVPEDIKKLPVFKFEVELIRTSDYEMIERVDPFATSIFDFPYVIFEWDASLDDMGYREAYTKHIKAKYAEVNDVR